MLILLIGVSIVSIFIYSQKLTKLSSDDINWVGEINPIQDQVDDYYGPLPGEFNDRVGVKIQHGEGWQVYRLFPSGYLEVFHKNQEGDYKQIDLPPSWKRETYPMLIIPSPGRLHVIGYDVVKNVPSGRRLEVSQPGLDLFEITPQANNSIKQLASGIDLGAGIDSMVYGRMTTSSFSICAENKCAEIKRNGDVKYWALNSLRGHEFVEVAFDSKSAYALIREKWDDRINGPITEKYSQYSLVRLDAKDVKLQPITEDGIPFALALKDGKPIWRIAKTRQEMQDLFIYEISRMKNRGLLDYGDNNLEGRVAWSQAYYLNGLITTASNSFQLFDEKLKQKFRHRVIAEAELVATLADQDYPGYRVKRYSVDREPLLFALHLGRIAQLLSRASSESMGSPVINKALRNIRDELIKLNLTVEQIKGCEVMEADSPPCVTLYYREGIPFWADGINVPYNFISGYVAGLLSVSDNNNYLRLSEILMMPLYDNEKIKKNPVSWRYWWGKGHNGWGDKSGPSINTPKWQGNVAGGNLAHITYRSMDAAALLMLKKQSYQVAGSSEVLHFQNLVKNGLLLPQVNEQLSELGEHAELRADVAKRFARSSQAWQIQSQVWALLDIANQNK